MRRNRRIVNPAEPINWQHPLNVGLVSKWMALPYGMGYRGVTAYDLVRKSGNNGTLTNGPTYHIGQLKRGGFGHMNYILTSSQYVAITESSQLPAGASDRTYAVWFNTLDSLTTSNYRNILTYGSAAVGQGVFIALGNDSNFGNNGIGASQYGDAVGITGYNDGIWHQLVVMFSAGTWYVYIDGGASSTSKAMTTNTVLGGTAAIAKDVITGGGYWNGSLDDLSIWNRALSATEIYSLYEQSKRGYPDVLNWMSSVRYFVPAGGTSYNRTTTDAPTTVNSVTRLWTGARTNTDAPTTVNSVTRLWTGARTNTDAPTTSESLTRSWTGARTNTDAPTTSESLTRLWTGARTNTDAPTVSESVTRQFVGVRAATDAPTYAESVTRQFAGVRTNTDAPTYAESLARGIAEVRTATDATTYAESVTRLFVGVRSTTDAPTYSESAEQIKGRVVTTSDGVVLSESISTLRTFVRSLADASITSESLVRLGVFFRTTSDGITLADVATWTTPSTTVGPYFIDASSTFVAGLSINSNGPAGTVFFAGVSRNSDGPAGEVTA
jgi:hypothetical protein